MRKIYTLIVSILVSSCLSETNVDPGDSPSFIRYYNGGNNDEAKAIELAPDGGYAIVATTRIQKAETDPVQYRIKFIKTDSRGNPEVPQFFPSDFASTENFKASSIKHVPSGGYVIIGDRITKGPQGDTTRSLLIKVDEQGMNPTIQSYDYGQGKAVAVTSAGRYLMLTVKGVSGDTTMYLLNVNPSTFVPDTTSYYPAAGERTSIANKLLVDGQGMAVWAGAVTKTGLRGIRTLKTIPGNNNTEFDRLVGQPGFDLVGNDISNYSFNEYAVTGSTNRKPDGSKGNDTDILFVRMSSLGDTLSTRSYPLGDLDNQNDSGNSINSTSDGGLILLASVNSVGIKGRGDLDFYLIRIDAFGNTVWTNSFGSKFKDEGAAVLQAPDGGYVILGTTTQGALKILTLLKTDKNGKIE